MYFEILTRWIETNELDLITQAFPAPCHAVPGYNALHLHQNKSEI